MVKLSPTTGVKALTNLRASVPLKLAPFVTDNSPNLPAAASPTEILSVPVEFCEGALNR